MASGRHGQVVTGILSWVSRTPLRALIALAGLAILVYSPALSLPFIADDYVQIRLARDYGPVSGWSALAVDPLYRCRATSLVLTYWTERIFGLAPLAYNWSSLFLRDHAPSVQLFDLHAARAEPSHVLCQRRLGPGSRCGIFGVSRALLALAAMGTGCCGCVDPRTQLRLLVDQEAGSIP